MFAVNVIPLSAKIF